MADIASTINKSEGMIAHLRSWRSRLLSPPLPPAERSPCWCCTPLSLSWSDLNYSRIKLNQTSSRGTRIISAVPSLTSRCQIKTVTSSYHFSQWSSSLVANIIITFYFLERLKSIKFSSCPFHFSTLSLFIHSFPPSTHFLSFTIREFVANIKRRVVLSLNYPFNVMRNSSL